MNVKIFGREPAFWVGFIEAVLAMLLSLNRWSLTGEQVAAIMAVVTAAFGVYTAYVTQNVGLAILIGFSKAVMGLAAAYNFNLSTDQTSAVIGLITLVAGAFNRQTTSPVVEPSLASGGQVMPMAP
jgi:uncharacterized membrane protein HdeD (DUF308 family)